MNHILLYSAAAITALWGVAHLFATRGVVEGFGHLSLDNRRIITMEWLIEGVALISTASFVVVVTIIDPQSSLSSSVYAVATGTLISLAMVSLFTGFRIAFLPFRLCPLILSISAVLIASGAWF